MKKAARVFAFVEDRFETMLESQLEIQLAAVSDAVEESVREIVENDIDLDQIASDEVDRLVENHYFSDFDDMARDAVDEKVDGDFDLDDSAREKVDDWFENNEHSVRTIVENNIQRQVDEALEDAPHLVARVEHLEGQVAELSQRLATVAENAAGCLELLDERSGEIQSPDDITRIARGLFADMFVHVGRLLEADTTHHPAFEGVDE
jgi:polyhydroxyalkanoate synthesis regulator phasin